MQNVLFVLHNDFTSNSAVHVHNFANHLVNLGIDCTVAVPQNKETVQHLTTHRYRTATFDDMRRSGRIFKNHRGPDVVHAWTPREIVRMFCEDLRQRHTFKLFIHLEDNEDYLLESFTQKTVTQILRDGLDPFPAGLSHPRYSRSFLASADGVTIIIDTLREFVPGDVPNITLWPGVDSELFYPREPDRDLARKLGVPINSCVLCYTGNVHPANAVEVRSLYLAVAMLNREGRPTTLIRTGRDFCQYLGEDDHWAQKHTVNVGYVDAARIPELIALADVLIQPGRPDRFNDYRFPSKLPEFLAMGKPIILPATNIGRYMQHGTHAMTLPLVDALHIMETVNLILNDAALQQRLSEESRSFAQRHLNWQYNTLKLKEFYETVHRKEG